ncbi:MAG: hypothetical protein JKX70_00200 [Phycisphaerales bacterium]|nr:hypothetical protein [Phycisphaerales bacterium]
MMTSLSHAQIVYQVNRTIGGGTVTGFVTTDGTLGVLSSANIIDWELTLTSPNLRGGSTETISFDTQLQTFLNGSATTATATDLMFDLDAAGNNWFLLQGGSTNFWCIETGGCTSGGLGEHIGQNDDGSNVAESSLPTGNFVFASVTDPITYNVNRTIDQGSITGFITTDGTLGLLTSANIIDWELTLTAPNLDGGSPDIIDFDNQQQTFLSGAVTTATATDLSFDISGASGDGFILFQGAGFGNFYCIETANAGCTGAGIGEHIGFESGTTNPAQTGQPTGNFVFATTSIRYNVSRFVESGSVVGFIETDGTLGTLTTANITDWELTLTSPDLLFGDVESDTISFSDSLNTFVGGVITATATDMMFDMTGSSGEGTLTFQGSSFNFWCIETAAAACFGVGSAELIGFDTAGSAPAETGFPTGNFVFASTKIRYGVNRVVDQGTITGFIETDGTLGILTGENITDWVLTLTAPNLEGGSPDVIEFANQQQTLIFGSVVTATTSDIFFDISGASGNGLFIMQAVDFGNFWCLETADSFCTGEGIGEHLGRDADGSLVAQTGQPTGNFSIASVLSPIIYQVNRVIADGTVTGFIETDGTMGVLAAVNITNWELTLTAPNLFGGPVDTIDFGSQAQTFLQGAGTTATSTSLLFDMNDFSMGDSVFVVQGGSGNFWCIETAPVFCFETGEEMGFNLAGDGAAQSVPQIGKFVFATNCRADLNGDTVLNFFDVAAFLSAFTSGDPIADFTGEGSFNFFDIAEFLTQFSAGCP